jgi:lysozyme family protein
MADFTIAVAKTELWEGGYSNNPNDSGGETYRGISRKNWPNWAGWAIIDNVRHSSPTIGWPDELNSYSDLQGLVIDFYRKNFWDYDGINDQDVAWKVFDLGVNVGKVHAVKILQQVVGTNQDGIYGHNTERLVNSHPSGSLATMIRTSAELYHKAIVQSHPEDAVFLKGWLARDEG